MEFFKKASCIALLLLSIFATRSASASCDALQWICEDEAQTKNCRYVFPDLNSLFEAFKTTRGSEVAQSVREACLGRPIRVQWGLVQGGSPGQIWFDGPGYRAFNEFPSRTWIVTKSSTITLGCNRDANGALSYAETRDFYRAEGTIFWCTATEPKTISITGLKETRPAETGGESKLELVVRVKENDTPKADVPVQLSIVVTPNSGGHEHHDANRPKGSLSLTAGKTDASGEIKLVFQAPIVSGIQTVKATCTDCTNEAGHEITVKVPDLVPINPNPRRQENGSFAYALTSVDRIHVGTARYHVGQYWLTKAASDSLDDLVKAFNDFGWGTVALNDASLIWGGVYDINGNWRNPHKGHRTGEEIDISFVRAGNVVPRDRQDSTYDEFCKKNNAAMPFNILHHFVEIPHFHVYLRKQKPCAKTEN
jgi:hypothetical protein